MAKYIQTIAQKFALDNVIALELLNEPWVFDDMAVIRDFYRTAIVEIRKFSELPLIGCPLHRKKLGSTLKCDCSLFKMIEMS